MAAHAAGAHTARTALADTRARFQPPGSHRGPKLSAAKAGKAGGPRTVASVRAAQGAAAVKLPRRSVTLNKAYGSKLKPNAALGKSESLGKLTAAAAAAAAGLAKPATSAAAQPSKAQVNLMPWDTPAKAGSAAAVAGALNAITHTAQRAAASGSVELETTDIARAGMLGGDAQVHTSEVRPPRHIQPYIPQYPEELHERLSRALSVAGFQGTLRPHQCDAVLWMSSRELQGRPAFQQLDFTVPVYVDPYVGSAPGYHAGGGGILADSPGLGKTVSLLGLDMAVPWPVGRQHHPEGSQLLWCSPRARTLLVVPVSIMDHWRSKLRQFCGASSSDICIWHGAKPSMSKLESARWIITTPGMVTHEYQRLRRLVTLLQLGKASARFRAISQNSKAVRRGTGAATELATAEANAGIFGHAGLWEPEAEEEALHSAAPSGREIASMVAGFFSQYYDVPSQYPSSRHELIQLLETRGPGMAGKKRARAGVTNLDRGELQAFDDVAEHDLVRHCEAITGAARVAPKHFPLLLLPYSRVVVDEAHVARNIAAHVNTALCCLRAPAKWLLTATPFNNEFSDLQGLCRVLSLVPDPQPGVADLVPPCDPRWWTPVTYSKAPIIHAWQNAYVLRRHKLQPGLLDPPLPPKRYHDVSWTTTSQQELDVYNFWGRLLLDAVRALERRGKGSRGDPEQDGNSSLLAVLVKLLRQRQLAFSPLLMLARHHCVHWQPGDSVSRSWSTRKMASGGGSGPWYGKDETVNQLPVMGGHIAGTIDTWGASADSPAHSGLLPAGAAQPASGPAYVKAAMAAGLPAAAASPADADSSDSDVVLPSKLAVAARAPVSCPHVIDLTDASDLPAQMPDVRMASSRSSSDDCVCVSGPEHDSESVDGSSVSDDSLSWLERGEKRPARKPRRAAQRGSTPAARAIPDDASAAARAMELELDEFYPIAGSLKQLSAQAAELARKASALRETLKQSGVKGKSLNSMRKKAMNMERENGGSLLDQVFSETGVDEHDEFDMVFQCGHTVSPDMFLEMERYAASSDSKVVQDAFAKPATTFVFEALLQAMVHVSEGAKARIGVELVWKEGSAATGQSYLWSSTVAGQQPWASPHESRAQGDARAAVVYVHAPPATVPGLEPRKPKPNIRVSDDAAVNISMAEAANPGGHFELTLDCPPAEQLSASAKRAAVQVLLATPYGAYQLCPAPIDSTHHWSLRGWALPLWQWHSECQLLGARAARDRLRVRCLRDPTWMDGPYTSFTRFLSEPDSIPQLCPLCRFALPWNWPGQGRLSGKLTLLRHTFVRIFGVTEDGVHNAHRRRAIVFSTWTSGLDLIERMAADIGLTCVRIDGDMPETARRAALAEFKDVLKPEPHLLLATYGAGGVGLDLAAQPYPAGSSNARAVAAMQEHGALQVLGDDGAASDVPVASVDADVETEVDSCLPAPAVSEPRGLAGDKLWLRVASIAVLADFSYNPAVEEQAMDRVHRMGQMDDTAVVRLIARGTLDERVLEIQGRKQGEAAFALDLAESKIGTNASSATSARSQLSEVREHLEALLQQHSKRVESWARQDVIGARLAASKVAAGSAKFMSV